MAGKVAQIRELMAGDNLARQLSGLYNNWWIQRREKEQEWRELRNYLFATDTTKTTKKPFYGYVCLGNIKEHARWASQTSTGAWYFKDKE